MNKQGQVEREDRKKVYQAHQGKCESQSLAKRTAMKFWVQIGRPDAEQVFDRKHDHRKDLEKIKETGKPLIDFLVRGQDEKYHVQNDKCVDEMNEVPVMVDEVKNSLFHGH